MAVPFKTAREIVKAIPEDARYVGMLQHHPAQFRVAGWRVHRELMTLQPYPDAHITHSTPKAYTTQLCSSKHLQESSLQESSPVWVR